LCLCINSKGTPIKYVIQEYGERRMDGRYGGKRKKKREDKGMYIRRHVEEEE